MATTHTFINRYGDEWVLAHKESEHLTTIDGFLMTWCNNSRITLSVHLSPFDKTVARKLLEDELSELPLGSAVTILWQRDGGASLSQI